MQKSASEKVVAAVTLIVNTTIPKVYIKSSYASETTLTDGKRVNYYFGNVGLFRFDIDGKEFGEECSRLNLSEMAGAQHHRSFCIKDAST